MDSEDAASGESQRKAYTLIEAGGRLRRDPMTIRRQYKRGKLDGFMGEDGRLYVLLDPDDAGRRPVAAEAPAAAENVALVDQKPVPAHEQAERQLLVKILREVQRLHNRVAVNEKTHHAAVSENNGGRIVVMALPAPEHSRIIGNLAGRLDRRRKPPCGVYVDASIVLPDRADAQCRADLAVSCTSLESGATWVPDPILIAEVVSPATLVYDRGVKVYDYRAIASLREIVLLYTAERRADLWRRSGGQWVVTTLVGDATLRLESADATLSLAEIYEGAPA